MSDLLNLVRGLQHIIESNDWTNSPQRQEMAEEYFTFCSSYVENIEKCREMLDRKMLMEASDFSDNQDPPLPRQLELLKFPGLENYHDLCLIYDWPDPPELDGSVLEQIKTLYQDAKNFQPLLNAYRQIVRTNNVKMKVQLLRRLLKMDPRSKEWKTALTEQETLLMDQEIQTAKEMILGKDYDGLQQQQKKITDSEWMVVTPPEQVVNKIESVLETYHRESLKRLAESCLNSINEAYSSFDIDGLGKALSEWKDLISRQAYQPEDFEVRQVQEAEEYWLQQQKQRQEDQMFESLLENLRQQMENNGAQEDIDLIFNQLVLMGRSLPAHIEQQYYYMKENYEIIQKR